jgi:hypothetical protein
MGRAAAHRLHGLGAPRDAINPGSRASVVCETDDPSSPVGAHAVAGRARRP